MIELYYHSWFMHACVHTENIVEAALCKSVLKPLREPIYQSLEKLHISDSSMKQLTQNQVQQNMYTSAVVILIVGNNRSR